MRAQAASSTPLKLEVTATASRYSDTQREYIFSWIRQLAPEAARDTMSPAVEEFLDELRRSYPGEFDRLLSPGFPVHRFRSMLLRHVSAQLKGPENEALRAKVARERVRAVLEQEGAAEITSEEVAKLIGKIEQVGSIHVRRLQEGRTEDSELVALIKRAREGERATVQNAAPAVPRELTAADIVSEFARRNQDGASTQKIQAISLRGTLTTPDNHQLELFLYKLQPDRFRMAVQSNGVTQTLTGFDGQQYWAQGRGGPVRVGSLSDAGSLKHLGELVDPLFGGRDVAFTRFADREEAGAKLYRIEVKRRDGSGHIAWIDPETFHQVGRETDENTVVRYSDFREIDGVNMAFREEATSAAGKKTVLVISRVTLNPALIAPFFEPNEAGSRDYFLLESLVNKPVAVSSK